MFSFMKKGLFNGRAQKLMHVAENARLESKIFKRPKNREDGSDFDEIRNRSDASCLMKNFRTIETNEQFPKNWKNYRNSWRQ